MIQTRFYSFPRVMMLSTVLFGASFAQSPFTFHVGGGYTPVTGQLGDRLHNGWNFTTGGGMNFGSRFGMNLEYQLNGMGVRSTVLQELQVPQGNARIWSLTLNPVIRFADSDSRVIPYVTGGGGYYRRTVEFTEPTTNFINIFNPWWGWIGPVEVPANRILGSVSRGAGGFNVGAGVSFRLGQSNTKIFTEGRYHYADMAGTITRIVPITVGLRW